MQGRSNKTVFIVYVIDRLKKITLAAVRRMDYKGWRIEAGGPVKEWLRNQDPDTSISK